MPENLSIPRSIKHFLDQLGPGRNEKRPVREVIASTFKLKADSDQLEVLIEVQLKNFRRLLDQISLSDIEDDAQATYTNRQTLGAAG